MIHILIVVGMIFSVIFILAMTTATKIALETGLRIASIIVAFLLYFGSKAVGISIPDLILSAIQTSNPIAIGMFGAAVPFSAGAFSAWYVLRNMKKQPDIAVRAFIMIMTFVIILLGDVYLTTYKIDTQTEGINKFLLPNITFTAGVILYIIFNFVPTKDGGHDGWDSMFGGGGSSGSGGREGW